MVITALFTIAKIRRQPVSTDKWIKKMWYRHTMACYAALKKGGNSAVCDNMDGLGRHYAE